MRYVLAFSIVILGCSCSLAQQPKEYTLVLTQEELTLVGTALAEMPWSKVNGLLGKIQKQVLDQQKSKEPQKGHE